MKWLLQWDDNIIADEAFGLRRPGTKIGEWDGAFVYEKNSREMIIGVYVKEKDYIGFPKSSKEVAGNCEHFRAMGWRPMNREDISRTAGVILNNDTRISAPTPTLIQRIGCYVGVNWFFGKNYYS